MPGTWPNAAAWNAPFSRGSLEAAGRFDFLALDQGVPGLKQGGAKGGEAAIRWWATSFLAVSLAGYYLRYDVAPIEEPTQRDSWLALSRLTFRW